MRYHRGVSANKKVASFARNMIALLERWRDRKRGRGRDAFWCNAWGHWTEKPLHLGTGFSQILTNLGTMWCFLDLNFFSHHWSLILKFLHNLLRNKKSTRIPKADAMLHSSFYCHHHKASFASARSQSKSHCKRSRVRSSNEYFRCWPGSQATQANWRVDRGNGAPPSTPSSADSSWFVPIFMSEDWAHLKCEGTFRIVKLAALDLLKSNKTTSDHFFDRCIPLALHRIDQM